MREIAESYQISLEHLRKVIHRLARNGYLVTSQGRGGGFMLGRSPEQIHIGEVVALMEETMDIVDCQRQPCPLCGACSLKDALNGAREAFIQHLNHITLADLLKNKRTYRMIKQLS